MQRNWIGKTIEVRINFPVFIRGQTSHIDVVQEVTKATHIAVETERVDLLHGVQYLALSAHHPLVVSLARDHAELKLFLESLPSLPADSNAGFQLPQIHAENPLTKLPDSPSRVAGKLPVYVARYVSNRDGNSAVMGVPGHDVRDWAFWKEHCPGQHIYKVIEPDGLMGREIDKDQPMVWPGALNSLCGNFAGLSSSAAREEIVRHLRKHTMPGTTKLATRVENWRLRDWLISRQRYWGTPIPVIHCRKCGPLPVPAENLPVELPKLEGDWFKGKKGNPLENADDWVNVTCHKCGGPAKRETDTMDTFMDSSWYFMRYIDPANSSQPCSPRAANAWLPVDIYVGGVEHAILHLLYARFICKVFSSNGLWPLGQGKEAEPFRKLITQGMVHGKTFSDPKSGRFLKSEELDLSDPSSPKMVSSGELAKVSWEKMSKSKHNGVDPVECIKKYGADVTRAHILFQAPVTQVLEWDEEKIIGIQRWFGRIWGLNREVTRQLTAIVPLDSLDSHDSQGEMSFGERQGNQGAQKQDPLAMPHHSSLTESEIHTWTEVQNSIFSVRTSLETTFALNTIVSDLMQLTNTLISTADTISPAVNYNGLSMLLRMLAPIAPAFAEECWENLHVSIPTSQRTPGSSLAISIFDTPFPARDGFNQLVLQSWQTCVVQENGKKRLVLKISQVPDELLKKAKIGDLQWWIMREIEETNEGGEWLARAREERKSWERIVVANQGRVVNFVAPKWEGVKVKVGLGHEHGLAVRNS